MQCLLISSEELSEVPVCVLWTFCVFVLQCVFLYALRNEGWAWLIIVAERVC